MAFNSAPYVFFYLVVLFVSWRLVGLPTLRFVFLLLASYYFYVSNNYYLIFLIIFQTQVDYFASLAIEKNKNEVVRKWILALALGSNLTLLCFFKYFNFFGKAVFGAATLFGGTANWVDWHILLPVGISFYTFQTMSYTIDVYRREIRAERSWLKFSFYVAYFPHLVAGPIVRAKDLLPQFYRKPELDTAAMEESLFRICRGFFKKVVIADFLAIYADRFFDDPALSGGWMAWLGVYCFAFQIYYDFGGYSDIAIGAARLMGYEFKENFRRPYVAVSPSDFWRRWHISLSQWLRDYLYISLGGSRKGKGRTYLNLMITMLLGGLWHGAAWTFVLWGLCHGLMLVADHAWRGRQGAPLPLPDAVKSVITFQWVCFSWVLFRSSTLSQVSEAMKALFRYEPLPDLTLGVTAAAGAVFLGWALQFMSERTDYKSRFLALPLMTKSFVYTAAAILIVVVGSASEYRPFIYFQF